jgi:hypothetical protein
MRGVRKGLVLLAVTVPGIAWGADVRLSLGVSAEYDDNVFRTPDDSDADRDDDVVFRFSPLVRLVEDREQFNYSLGYTLPYEVGVMHDHVSDLNHFVSGDFNYRLSPQTEIFGTESLYYVRGLFRQQDSFEDPTTGEIGDSRERILSNSVGVGAVHHFTPRLSGSVRVNQNVYDTTQAERADNLGYGGVLNANYRLTPHHLVGGGFSASRQSFDEIPERSASDTNYYNLFGSWEWLFDETTVFKIQIGPTLIQSKQDSRPATVPDQPQFVFTEVPNGSGVGDDSIVVFEFDPMICPVVDGNTLISNEAGTSCPQVLLNSNVPAEAALITTIRSSMVDLSFLPGTDSGGSDLRITYFANASLSKRWSENVISSLSYSREESPASGIDGGAVLDALIASTSWRISDRWDASVRADWTLRTSATSGNRTYLVVEPFPSGLGFDLAESSALTQISSDDSLDTQRWGMAARLAYRLTKNTVTALQYAYNKQSSDSNTVGETSDFDNHLVTFTVQYNFEPIPLWW